MTDISPYILLSAFLFCVGIFGVLTRRNIVGILMSIEIILNAANINLIATSRYLGSPNADGQVFTLFVIAIAAAGSVVGLVLVIALHRNAKSIYTDNINLMKW